MPRVLDPDLGQGVVHRPLQSIRGVPQVSRNAATNSTAKVVARYGVGDFRRSGRDCVVRHTLRDVTDSGYIRVRGTSTEEMEPAADGVESPWEDVWLWSNPVFVKVG